MSMNTNFLMYFCSSQMADDQEYVGEQGAGEFARTDSVDAKPDRTSFMSILLK